MRSGLLLLLVLASSAHAGGKRNRVTFAPIYYVPQPYVLVLPNQPRYYQPLPQSEGSRQTWSGGSTDHFQNWSVDQRYAAEASHQCQHGAGGSECKSGFESNRDYQMSENGEPFAGGALNDRAGGTRSYQHNGNPYAVQQMLQREREHAELTPLLAEASTKIAEVKVQIRVGREKLMRERNAENSAETDRRLAHLDEIERKLLSLEDRSMGYRRQAYGN